MMCFFVRREGRRDRARPFLSAVTSQLLELVGQGTGLPPDFDDLRDRFQEA